LRPRKNVTTQVSSSPLACLKKEREDRFMKNIRIISWIFLSAFLFVDSYAQLQVTFSGDTTKIWNKNISWYCDAKFTMLASRVGDSITVIEKDTADPVHCLCYFTVCTSIIGLPSGNYTAYIKRQFKAPIIGGHKDSTFDIGAISFSVNMNSSQNFMVKSYQSLCSQSPVSVEKKETIPNTLYLLTNYPNPFNPRTFIHYAIPQSTHLRIAIYNIQGSLIKVVVDKYSTAGNYDVSFDGNDCSSGVYIVRMTSDQTTLVNKIALIK